MDGTAEAASPLTPFSTTNPASGPGPEVNSAALQGARSTLSRLDGFGAILVGSSCFSCGGHEMLCPECGSQVADGQERCPECRLQIRKPGLLQRLRDFF